MILALTLAAFIVCFAAFMRAISGFGFTLISTPLLTFVMEVKSAVIIANILGIVTSLIVAIHLRRHIDFRRFGIMSVGCVFGTPLGAYLLSTLSSTMIKLAIASLVIPFSVLLLLGYSHPIKRDNLGCGIAGFMSGVLTASTSLGGPPTVIFMLNQGMVKEKFVATMSAQFFFAVLISVGAFSSMGIITNDILIKAAILIPPMGLGTYLGIKVLPRINPTVFRRLTAFLLTVTALVIIVTVLLEIF